MTNQLRSRLGNPEKLESLWILKLCRFPPGALKMLAIGILKRKLRMRPPDVQENKQFAMEKILELTPT
jgi:hypothetical protein